MKKLRYLLLATSLAAGLSNALAARAQAPPPGLPLPLPDTTRFYQNELGLTASPRLASFFTANRSLPVGLIYKRHFSPKHALRVRVTGLYSRQIDSTNFAGLLPGSGSRLWETIAYLGYERRAQIAPRWQGYYGLEAGTGVRRRKVVEKVEQLTPDYRIRDERLTTYNRWFLRGQAFAGITYQITRRLALTAETALQIQYYTEHNRKDEKTFYLLPDGSQTKGQIGYNDFTSKRIMAVWRPVQLLTLSSAF